VRITVSPEAVGFDAQDVNVTNGTVDRFSRLRPSSNGDGTSVAYFSVKLDTDERVKLYMPAGRLVSLRGVFSEESNALEFQQHEASDALKKGEDLLTAVVIITMVTCAIAALAPAAAHMPHVFSKGGIDSPNFLMESGGRVGKAALAIVKLGFHAQFLTLLAFLPVREMPSSLAHLGSSLDWTLFQAARTPFGGLAGDLDGQLQETDFEAYAESVFNRAADQTWDRYIATLFFAAVFLFIFTILRLACWASNGTSSAHKVEVAALLLFPILEATFTSLMVPGIIFASTRLYVAPMCAGGHTWCGVVGVVTMVVLAVPFLVLVFMHVVRNVEDDRFKSAYGFVFFETFKKPNVELEMDMLVSGSSRSLEDGRPLKYQLQALTGFALLVLQGGMAAASGTSDRSGKQNYGNVGCAFVFTLFKAVWLWKLRPYPSSAEQTVEGLAAMLETIALLLALLLVEVTSSQAAGRALTWCGVLALLLPLSKMWIDILVGVVRWHLDKKGSAAPDGKPVTKLDNEERGVGSPHESSDDRPGAVRSDMDEVRNSLANLEDSLAEVSESVWWYKIEAFPADSASTPSPLSTPLSTPRGRVTPRVNQKAKAGHPRKLRVNSASPFPPSSMNVVVREADIDASRYQATTSPPASADIRAVSFHIDDEPTYMDHRDCRAN